jgi:Ca-activated chloride channel family protein
MKKAVHIIFLLIACIFLVNNHARSQYVKEKKTTRILFIFDASNSMNGKWESDKKITIARRLLSELVDSLEKIEGTQLALRVYGHQFKVPPQVCTDSKLEVPFAWNNAPKIREKLNEIEPKGTTPIAYSLELSGNDFPPCKNCKNVIVLITDGIEACEGDPCAIALMLQRKGISLKPYVIGIGLDIETKKAFECVGKFYDADKEERFEDILKEVVKQALNQTSAQINLLDIYNKPTETNVNMTFYDQKLNKRLFNTIHTLNKNGDPDTIFLEPRIKYKIVVNTIPQVIIDNIQIKPQRHNIIKAPAPQGYLNVTPERGVQYRNEKFIVRKAGELNTLNVQTMGEQEKYIVGKYDIELLTLPRIYYYNVEINQSKTTTIKIPEPGIANISMPAKGYGSLYVFRNGEQEWVCNLNQITKTALNLQPGNYMVIYRTGLATKMDMSEIKEFKVISGRSVSVEF